MLKNYFEHSATNVIKDDIGNCLTMDFEIEKDYRLRIINIYYMHQTITIQLFLIILKT